MTNRAEDDSLTNRNRRVYVEQGSELIFLGGAFEIEMSDVV